MATLPTATECRDHLEHYGITTEVISKEWIEDERDNTIVPLVEDMVGYSLSSEETIVDYHSGSGSDMLFLNRKGITEITKIELVSGADIDGAISLASVELLSKKGALKAISGLEQYLNTRSFPKGKNNIRVTYKIGGSIENRIAQGVKKLVCIAMLDMIESRTGGGNLTVQGFGRQYGNMGKYTNIRTRWSNQAMKLLKVKSSSVVGS